VTGVVIWYVPIEEYTFFVLQPLLTGAWLYLMARHLRLNISEVPLVSRHSIRRNTTALVFLIWLAFVLLLISGWQPGTYMGLLMVWALPPVMIQTAFGADILWKNWRLIVLTVVPTTLYLAAADKLAITSGTWTINPEQSLGINLLGRLPIEELVFFFMTNLLIGLGITLVSSVESRARAEGYVRAVKAMVSYRKDRGALTEKS
jgi:lycopene cyclase domain-containing protein